MQPVVDTPDMEWTAPESEEEEEEGPLPSGEEVEAMGVKQLKETIEWCGFPHDDCVDS